MLSFEQQNMLVLESIFSNPLGYNHDALLKKINLIKDEVYDSSQETDVVLKIILRLLEKTECFLCQTAIEPVFVKKRQTYKTVDDFRQTLNQIDQEIKKVILETNLAIYSDLQKQYLKAAIQYVLTIVANRVYKLEEINDSYFMQSFGDSRLGITLTQYGFVPNRQTKR